MKRVIWSLLVGALLLAGFFGTVSASTDAPSTRHAINLSGGINTADAGFTSFEHNSIAVVTTTLDYRVVATVYTIEEGYPYFDAEIRISAGPGWVPEVYKGQLLGNVEYIPCEHYFCSLPWYAVFKVAFPSDGGPVEVGMHAPRPPYRPSELTIRVHAFDPAMTHWEGAVATVRNSRWGLYLPFMVR